MFLGKLVVCLIVTGIVGIIFLKVPYYQENMTSVVMPLTVRAKTLFVSDACLLKWTGSGAAIGGFHLL